MTIPLPPYLIELLPAVKPPRIIFESAELGQGFYPQSSHLIGFGFDGTACFRKGTKDGPDAIRAVSDGIESYSPYLDADLNDIRFFDCGNLSLGADGTNPNESGDDKKKKCNNLNLSDQNISKQAIDQQWQYASDTLTQMLDALDLKNHQIKLLTLGGEHSISYAPIKAYLNQYPDLVLIHLDAHADLRDGYEGHHHSHASIIYRVQEHFGEHHQLIQYGIRSGTRDEYRWMNENNSLCHSLIEFLMKVDQIDNTTPIYLTLDLDYFDPSFFPGTGTPEPGGEDFHSFIKLIKRLKNKNFVGCDVVELAPNIDSSGNSDVFAAKVVRELLLSMQTKGQEI